MRRSAGARILLLFAAGCLLAVWSPALPEWSLLGLLSALALAATLWRPTRLPAVAVLGAIWVLSGARLQIEKQWPPDRAGEIHVLTGTIIELPRPRDESVRLLFRPDPGQLLPAAPRRIQVDWYRPNAHLEPGARWRLSLRLLPPTGRDNPGGFDYRRYLLSQRIDARATLAGSASPIDRSFGGGWIDRLRQRLSVVIQAETDRLDAAALKRALGVADRSAIDDALAERLRHTGTSHLLAISGLHVGMVAGVAGLVSAIVFSPLLLVIPGLDRRRVALIGGLAAAIGYAALAGFTLPTQRALVMLAAVAAALGLRRAMAPAQALLIALAGVLVYDPLAPLSAGFWLSFSAVAVLVWSFAWRSPGRRGWLSGLLRAQVVVLVGLLPLNAGLFGQLVPGALLANLVAIPLVGLWVLPVLLLEIVTLLAGLPELPALIDAETGLVLLLGWIEWVDARTWSQWSIAAGGPLALAAAAFGGWWLLGPPGWPARSLGAALMLPLLLPRPEAVGSDELTAWVLDAGDGLAVLMVTPDHAMLYDTGPGDGAGQDFIGTRLNDWLARYGHAQLGHVVISHRHRGHSGGQVSVLALSRPDRVYSAIDGVGRPCRAGMLWTSGGYRFEFLHPTAGLPDLGGGSSCVLLVSGPGGRMLLTGGIDRAVEARLARAYDGPPVDVVVLSSGGHRRGTSAALLRGFSPVMALAAVPAHDRYQRPHDAVRQRLEDFGVGLLTTGQCGALRIRLTPDQSTEIRSMATLNRRFWRPAGQCP